MMKFLGKLRDTIRSALRQRRWTQNFWGNTTEVVFAGALVLVGLMVFVWGLVGQYQQWPSYVPLNWTSWIIRGGLCLGLIGIGMFRLVRILFLHSGSAEQRSNFLNQAFDLEYLRPPAEANQQYPGIRSKNSRLKMGQKLRYRIDFNQPMRLRFWGLAFFSLLMVTVSTVNGATAWGDFRYGHLDRLAITLILLVMMLGLTAWLVWQTGKTLFRQARLGPTILELSQHPLRIGQKFDFFIQQTGDIQLEKLKVLLECREEVTYHQGTDVCRDQNIIRSDCVADFREIDLSKGPFEQQFSVQLPKGVMHSFDASSNQIAWYAIICGDHQGCPEFKLEFPIIVVPNTDKVLDEKATHSS